MKAVRFFQNEEGDWKIVQLPNLLLLLWLFVISSNALFFNRERDELSILSGMLLFSWSYSELRQGESPFRKTLGAIVLFMVIARVLMV
jgi:hypothetical protein